MASWRSLPAGNAGKAGGLAVALGLGISSASIALRGDYPFGGIEVGPWKAWPQVGSREADPYARAIVTRRAEIPLAVGEGLALTATPALLSVSLAALSSERVRRLAT